MIMMSGNSIVFPPQILFNQTESHIHLEFTTTFNVLSSAVLNGGFQEANHIVNLKVPKESYKIEKPDITINNYCIQYNWKGSTVGMMTAASMKSLRIRHVKVENVNMFVLITAGLSNPRRAGDYTECRMLFPVSLSHDTINIILISTASFAPAAMVEAIMIITEAKTAALQNANIKSPISNKIATGTGTDSIVIATQKNEKLCIEFCGKHTLIGELVGQLVIDAITDSINWDLENNDYHSTFMTTF